MLASLLHKRSLLFMYRLVKPNISEFKSVEDLEYDESQRELAMIQEINANTLKNNKAFTKLHYIAQTLSLSDQQSQDIAQKHVKFSGISPRSLKHYTLQQNLTDGKIDYPFLLQQIEANLPQLDSVPMHFSYKRGVAVISEYQFDKKCGYIFNLPQNINSKDISEKLGIQTVKQIKIQYCRLGLPAYAKVTFNSDEAVTNLILNNKHYIELNNRICFVKTHFDQEKLGLKNRRLVIQNLSQNQHDLSIELSKYGRVLHLDYPTFVSRNVSVEQVKEKYKNSDALIKINFHRKNGSIDSQYYPSAEQLFKRKTPDSETDFGVNLLQKREQQNAIYKSRSRYAQQVDVFEGKQNQISIKNLGYCIVTYSCTQQAQNCYFNKRFQSDIKLYDSKKTEQFSFDKEHRKRILRFVDNEYRKVKQKLQNSKSDHQQQIDDNFKQMNFLERLVDMEQQSKILKQAASEYTEDQMEVINSYFRTRFHEIKNSLNHKMGTKSFHELAEEELFGRVLPKKEKNKSKIALEAIPQVDSDLQEILQAATLRPVSSHAIKDRNDLYKRIKHRQTKRLMGKGSQHHQVDDNEIAEEEKQTPEVVQEQDLGKRGFSTIKKRTIAFRPRNPVEQVNYILRYTDYTKDIINEYQGVFPENRLKPNLQIKSSFLNPEGLIFEDGSEYITEDDLAKFLECMRDMNEAEQTFTQFWKDLQIYKSKSINVIDFKYQVQNKYYDALERYTDTGVVKEIYEVQPGEDIQAKTNYLNAVVASFGEEFRVHDNGSEKVIVKISKVQSIYPFDKLTRLAMAKKKFIEQNALDDNKLRVFDQYKDQMLESGQIPAQIRKEFNIPSDKNLDSLFQELATQAGIYKKDIQKIVNMKNFTEQQLGADAALQIELQKVRLCEKESHVHDYAKDPSNIQVRDKEGYFKVSKFRQI